MNREQFKELAKAELLRQVPGLTVDVLNGIVNAPAAQHWFDRIATQRPRGFVAWVRRLRGRGRGLTVDQRRELEQLVADAVKKL